MTRQKGGIRIGKERWFLLWNLLISIILGGVLYLMLDPSVRFVTFLKLGTAGTAISQGRSSFLTVIRNFLPDMLWGYALTFALQTILRGNTSRPWLAGGIALIFSWLIEVMQWTGWMPGTFDFFDLAAESASVVLAVFIISIDSKRRKRE